MQWIIRTSEPFVRLAAVLMALGVALPAGAAARGTRPGAIGGVVVSAISQRPLPGAALSVEGGGPATTADGEGRFLLTAVAEGTHRLLVTHQGFLPALVTGVVVAPGRETPLEVRLQDEVRIQENVSVSPSAFEKPLELTNSATLMSYEEVRRAPGALADIGRMVQAMPGLGARDDQRNDIVARGGSPSENLTLVDGVEVPNLSHFGGQGASGGPITMLNSQLISDTRFLAGGFPSEYGNRLSSVLDVNLREGSRRKTQFEVDLGMAGAGVVLEGPLGSKGSWLFSGRRSYIDLIADAYGLTSIPQYANYQAKASYETGTSGRLALISLGGWDSIGFAYDASDTEDPNTITGESSGWRIVNGLSWRQLIGSKAVATLAASHGTNRYDGEAFDQQRDGALVQRNRSTEQELTLRGDLSFSTPGGALKLGASAKRFAADTQIALPIGNENPFSTEPDARLDAVDLDTTLDAWQPGGYVQAAQRLGRRLTLNVGTRLDRFAITDDSEWSPNAGLVLHVRGDLDLSASAGRYHQLPTLLFFQTWPGNAVLQPIRADHLVAGIELRPAGDTRITVEAYEKRYERYPVSQELPFITMADAGEQYEISTLVSQLASQGEGRSRGLELFAQKKIGGRLWGQISYALSKTEQRALDGAWRPGSFDLPHVLSVVAGTSLTRRLEMSGKFTYTSGRPTTPILMEESIEQNRLILDADRYNGERAPAYHRLDLRFDHRTSHRWGSMAAYVELDNVYNRTNVRTYYWNPKTRARYDVPQLSFMVIGGFEIRF